jgi:two-component system nitrogen regulation response regulator GlnG
MPSVLIIDDEESIAWGLKRAFTGAGYAATVAATAEAGLKKAIADPPDVVFLDVRLPGMDGLTALEKLKSAAANAAVVIMTAHGNLDTAVKAVAGGAFDYLAKPFDLTAALDVASRALTRTTVAGVGDTGDKPALDDELVGRSPVMQAVFKRIALVAPTTACVLITGESGTGKELVARAVHAHSPRKDKPFLPVHVAALNPNVIESELFGHVKGAFTGADRTRPGLFALADGGTVFLDELADIPLAVQVKLLRVLERQEVLPVGGVAATRVDVRVVSATNADLAAAIAAGGFRADLFFRLNVYPIHLPPLADRSEDIPLLAGHLLRRIAPAAGPLPADTTAALVARPWPGNVRELRNALEHAAILARAGPIRPEHVPAPVTAPVPPNVADRLRGLVREWVNEEVRLAAGTEPAELYQKLLDRLEPALLDEVLSATNGNRLAAARWLGLARGTVRKLLAKHGLGDAEVE